MTDESDEGPKINMPPQKKPKSQPKQNPAQTTKIAQKKQCMVIDIRELGNKNTSPNKKSSTSTTVKKLQLN